MEVQVDYKILKHPFINYQAPIKRRVAIELIRLMGGKHQITIHTDRDNNLTSKECNTNTLALIKSLKSIAFITIDYRHESNHTIQATIKLSSLGKDYVRKYIHRYRQIYRYLKFGKDIGSIRHILTFLIFSVNCLLWLPIMVTGFNYMYLCQSQTLQGVIGWGTVACAFNIPTLLNCESVPKRIARWVTSPYSYEDINKDIQSATRISFINFFKNSNIQEPDYRFGHNSNLPKIDTYLFNN